jgi:tape measure domain-containing protein
MSTLSTNQIVVEYIIKGEDVLKAKNQFDGLTKAETESLNALKKINDQLKVNGDQAKKSGDDLVNALGKSDNQVKGLGSSLKGITPLLAGAFSIAAISAFTKQVIETTTKYQAFQKAIDFASGSQKEGAKNFEFLSELARKLGLDLEATAMGYKTFAASSNLAGVSIEETNRQFTSVSKAVAALGLSGEDAKGVFLALGQIISKGTVSSEELRGQIGERLPGAFNIAAKSMGVTTAELGKLLQKGEIASKDFLPKFATELEKTFGPEAEKNLNSLTASQNRFNNAIDGLVLAVGQKLEPFLKGAYDLAAGIATELAKVGKAAKKESAENLGLKRAEADIVKQLIKYGGDLTVQNQKFIRQQEAVLLLLGMEEKIYNQQVLVTEKRIMAQNDFNGVATKALKDAESELNILIAEEKELEKIAGIEVKRGEEKKVLNEADIKALEARFKLEEKRLEILTQIRKVELDSAGGNLGADKALYDAKLELRRKYTAQGLKFAKEETDLLEAQSKKTGEALIQQDLKDRMEGKNIMDQYHKDSEKSYDLYLKNIGDKKLKQIELDKSGNRDFIKDEQKKWQEIIQLTTEYSQVANDIVQGFANLRQARIDNEITQLNQKYSEEIRLAGDNQQKVLELKQKQEAEEKALRRKAFEAQRQAAIAEVIFRVAPIIAQQIAGVITAPLAIASYATAAAQIAFIAAQPVPEFKEGTKGKPFKGGKAIVGEIGKEWVVTTSGAVYETPGVATLVDLPKGSQVIPHHEVIKSERFMGSKLMNQGRGESGTGQIVERLISLENTMSKLPITSLTMDERGFTKKIQTKSRETRILNNRFGN